MSRKPVSQNHIVHAAGLVQTPTISLHGIDEARARLGSPEGTKSLNCNIRESRPFLTEFCAKFHSVFLAEGFIPAITPQSRPLRTYIMSTKYLHTDVLNEKPTLKGRGYLRSPGFDASVIYQKYKDIEWADEFPLERLCISEPSLKDFCKDGEFVRTGYRDIACVPFPGVPARIVAEIATQRSNETYEKAHKTISRKLPKCPILIPSTIPPREQMEIFKRVGDNKPVRTILSME